ncbi:MAG: GNAT family N-acetyltransferase [Candidatus Rhabdochlamydia sp.]
MLEGLDIRYTEESDGPFLKQWLDDPFITQWFPMKTPQEIEDAFRCWIGFHRYSCSLTAILQKVPCGMATLFLMPYKKVSHYALFKIVVDPQLHRQGIGSDLLKNVKHLAKNYFHLEKVGIEVFENNPLEALLKKQGFQQIFRHEGYVKQNGSLLAKIYWECVL